MGRPPFCCLRVFAIEIEHINPGGGARSHPHKLSGALRPQLTERCWISRCIVEPVWRCRPLAGGARKAGSAFKCQREGAVEAAAIVSAVITAPCMFIALGWVHFDRRKTSDPRAKIIVEHKGPAPALDRAQLARPDGWGQKAMYN